MDSIQHDTVKTTSSVFCAVHNTAKAGRDGVFVHQTHQRLFPQRVACSVAWSAHGKGLGWMRCRGQALQGSLFWRWYVRVYADEVWPSDYGVQSNDTTFAAIRHHTAAIKERLVSRAPESVCAEAHGLGCWVPRVQPGRRRCSTVTRCLPQNELCNLDRCASVAVIANRGRTARHTRTNSLRRI